MVLGSDDETVNDPVEPVAAGGGVVGGGVVGGGVVDCDTERTPVPIWETVGPMPAHALPDFSR